MKGTRHSLKLQHCKETQQTNQSTPRTKIQKFKYTGCCFEWLPYFCLAQVKVFKIADAKQLSEEIRRIIIGHHKWGIWNRKISYELKIPLCLIWAIIGKWKQHILPPELLWRCLINKMHYRKLRGTSWIFLNPEKSLRNLGSTYWTGTKFKPLPKNAYPVERYS